MPGPSRSSVPFTSVRATACWKLRPSRVRGSGRSVRCLPDAGRWSRAIRVGKSTLIRAIDPSLDIRTGEISESHRKGRHTTTFSTMYPLSEGGAVIDTPGIKGFGLIDIDDAELWHYFPEMLRVASGCRFYNCTHTHEPGCAVVEAVRSGEIALARYESYLKMLDEDDKYRK